MPCKERFLAAEANGKPWEQLHEKTYELKNLNEKGFRPMIIGSMIYRSRMMAMTMLMILLYLLEMLICDHYLL